LDFISQSLKCICTNADSFLNKFDEFKQRYVSESEKPNIIAITEVLPKNMRYTVNKAELDIEGSIRFTFIHALSLKLVSILTSTALRLFFTYIIMPRLAPIGISPELLTKASDLKFSHMIIIGDYNFPDIDWCT
jgi:hypothetical protein